MTGDVQDEPARPLSRVAEPPVPPARTPAGPRTLRRRRRIGLVAGVPAAVLVAASFGARLTEGRGSIWHLGLAVPGLLAAMVALVFLARTWEEPGYPRTALTVRGQRLSSAVLGLCMAEVVAGWFDPPAWLLTALALGWGAALVAAVVVALLERPVYGPG